MEDATRTEEGSAAEPVAVLRGSAAESLEFGLVLDARGFVYERVAANGEWLLVVAEGTAVAAREELARYAAERLPPRPVLPPFVPFAGSATAAAVYAIILILVAYCAGIQLFDQDWFDVGALEARAGAPLEWWRTLTALTLHVDQEHLLGNLLFGVGIGVLAGRVVGPGFAWACILLAGATANLIELSLSPPWHRAVGASTALFAALGLLAGFGWGQSATLRDRRLYRWAPLFGGVCLLALLGAGNEHVDVLGHVLGFVVGTGLGWLITRDVTLHRRGPMFQILAGLAALAALGAAWITALHG